ncbi:fungal specific transcription factor domain protein [Cladophialophora carrionii]|uniref:Fungal specific transcription factor domain protein n=1 Tax=Cladophialophora carrionii TaxID=86049 RepID=A0A1C1CWI0_9EURO|nr:fungal specific transcription factor domain protein [Cladophialophora carrionii]
MPRPRVKDEDRKRVARACDTCKRRKEKCDGQQPCLLCKRRGREPECVFSDVFSKGGSQRQTSTPSSQPITLKDALNESNDAEIAIESLLTLSGSRSAAKTPQYDRDLDDVISKAPVPKLARLLRDGRGKFIFVGDSSNLAFVQNIRRLVKAEIGECPLTSDPLRHAMCEVIPPHKVPTPAQSQHPKPTVAEAQDLIKHYLLASSGVIDLFDPDDISDHLLSWARDSTAETDFNSSIYYLVMAIGALTRTSSDLDQAEFYFLRGREIGVSSFLEDPSVLTIQAYTLITFYMLSAVRRNGAFMLLGIAVRAAYALGLHRSDISNLFEPRERAARERVWKSLRVLDLYMSGSLGRPPATSEVDGGSVSWNRSSRDYEDIQMNGRTTSATLRICFIFERILNEVYCRREVSVQLVESISRQYRDWTMQLPAGLQADSLDSKEGSTAPSLRQTIGIAHLKGAYYWSIILLTRPFLIFKVSSKIKGRSEDEDSAGNSVTMTLSEACIDAALRGIEIATDIVHTIGVPKRLFMITNSTFISAMVIGFAIFGDFDKSFPLLSSMAQAEAILTIMAKDDLSARRQYEITSYLRLAALEHINRRDQIQMQRRRQDIHNIFGDPINKANGSTPTRPSTGSHTPDQILTSDVAQNGKVGNALFDMADAGDAAPPWQLRFDMPPESRGPVLTTSGALAYAGEDSAEQIPPLPRTDFGQVPDAGYLSPNGSGIPSLPSYAEEFPLFSLMTEFDQLQDPFMVRT